MIDAFMVFFLTFYEIIKIGAPMFLAIFVVLALACYGISLVRLFFKI